MGCCSSDIKYSVHDQYYVNKVTPLPPVDGTENLVGWKMKECDYRANIEKYLSMLDDKQKLCFAPIDLLIENS